jgi:hypothetical protein
MNRDEPLLLLLGRILRTKWFKHAAILTYAGTGTVVPNSIRISTLDFKPFTFKKSIAVILAILFKARSSNSKYVKSIKPLSPLPLVNNRLLTIKA